jgi:hypothetical protein
MLQNVNMQIQLNWPQSVSPLQSDDEFPRNLAKRNTGVEAQDLLLDGPRDRSNIRWRTHEIKT